MQEGVTHLVDLPIEEAVVDAKIAAAGATIELLLIISEEARQCGNTAKLDSAEQAVERETQRRTAINRTPEPQPSTTFFVGSADPPSSLDEYSSALESTPQQALLVIYNGDSKGWEFALGQNRTVVGRNPDADVTLDEESVSRRRAAIIKSGDRYFLRDLESRNGTYCDGVLQGTERPLSDGDRFRIGNSDFIFRTRKLSH